MKERKNNKKEKFIDIPTTYDKKEKFIELEPQSEDEDNDESYNEEKSKKSKKGKKRKKESKSRPKSEKKASKKKKKDIQDIYIDDFKEDESLTIHNHNIIEDCCLACNEKNIFRAIKTEDKDLFNKCLKATDKISSIDYNLKLIGNLTPMEYIIKQKNKKLYTELVNFKKNEIKQQRINIPKDKLSFLTSGKSNIYTFGFNTRPVGLSRGNKLGNNAFVSKSSSFDEDFSTGYDLAIRKFMRYPKDDNSHLIVLRIKQ